MKPESMPTNDNLHQEIIQWACKCLASLGYRLKNDLPENVKNTPWSYVARFETTDGYIYLKYMPKLIALEASIIQILRDTFHATVPIVIAHNTELSCFLMKDAGRSLRELLKEKFDATLLCKAIDQFTALQLAVADRVDVLLEIGVPDWRLNKLPDLFRNVISQKDLLIADGLSEAEVNDLEVLFPKVVYLCQKLSDYAIKQTMVQPDFNDNNNLIDDKSQNITLIDLGEIAISHPFFSLINCLHVIKKHHALTDKDGTYLRIKDACLKNYMHFESKENLSDAFSMAHVLWFVYDICAQYRLMIACGTARIVSFQQGKLCNLLKEFTAKCITIDELYK